MILVTGASGNAGGAVLAAAAARGLPLRAMYRSTDDARHAPPGVGTAIADFADPASLRAALAGVATRCLLCAGRSRNWWNSKPR